MRSSGLPKKRVLIAVAASLVSACGAERPAPLTGAYSIVAGGSSACVLREGGVPSCWGSLAGAPAPTALPLTNVAEVAVGGTHACAVMGDQTVACWGSNELGELGNGTTSLDASPPGPVAGLGARPEAGLRAMIISATGPPFQGLERTQEYSCAVLPDQTVACWGADTYQELGSPVPSSDPLFSSLPVAVPGVADVREVALGGARAFAKQSDGTVVTWGTDYGYAPAAPGPFAGVGHVGALAAGERHVCALSDGTVVCWGDNAYGQLGTDQTPSGPTAVPGLAGIMAIAAGANHTCALTSDGTILCWGQNTWGQIGDGSILPATMPVPVAGISDAVAVSAGQEFTCALLANGQVRCWGHNDVGQLGTGSLSPASSNLPVVVTAH